MEARSVSTFDLQEPILAESECVERIRAGNAAAFEQLFFRYGKAMVFFARRIVKDPDVADNVVQDVFLKIWMHRSTLDPSRNIKTYLYTATRNQAINWLRRREVERRHAHEIRSGEGSSATPEDEWNRKEMRAAIQDAVKQLPERCRLIFSMNRFDRLTYAEIAEVLDISVKTVETQMGRALKFLRKRLAYLMVVFLV